MKKICFIGLLVIIVLIQHTVTGNGFDSGTLNAGDTLTWTFKKTGTFSYTCSNHPNMIGIVVMT